MIELCVIPVCYVASICSPETAVIVPGAILRASVLAIVRAVLVNLGIMPQGCLQSLDKL